MRFFRRKPKDKTTPSPPNRWAWVKWRWPFSRKNIPHNEETPSRPSRSRFRLPFKRDPAPLPKTTVSKPTSKEKPNDETDEESPDKLSKKTRFAIFVAALVLLKKLFSRKKQDDTPSVESSWLSKVVGILGQIILLGLLGLSVQYVDIEQNFQQYIVPLLRPSEDMLLRENQRLAEANREMFLSHAQMTSTAIYATAVMANVETVIARDNQQATARVAAMISQETAQARETEQASYAGRTATAVLYDNTVTAAAVQRNATATTEQQALALAANVRTATSNAQEQAVTVAAVVRTATVQAMTGPTQYARAGSGCTSAAMLFGLTICLGVFQQHHKRKS